ncbi:MAG: polyprenol monophosphomannose synthase [Nitrososphaerota archaeon]|jgi:glycosyltransferase involved in cell wall biosynthesis|uniref:polyprenol monophosphomannose synthase n=1 Tax=Candidatus Bathycorpusculum sp. TaxID=2994959 RepID=UPI00283700AD|nr:polyprenol monophosphomannose synthase [Candidatus Termitimicrobium sp.]MCL2431965.1 polyprenol monophosphomannose synthase [Candidatus Termitimicrobium sp.]MDR0492043.1 polyprenol monophosphomannose synthase [Nitrososphaerota archaeon]
MSYQLAGNTQNSEIGIILPTFDEATNIAKLIEDIENLNLDLSIMVIDDSSPDGTAKIVQEKQKKYSNLLLCNRPKKLGLGTAITEGFKIFLSQDPVPKYVFTMDADYSHDPQDIPKLLAVMQQYECGIVIGSRYSKGGKIMGWPLSRKLISKTANALARASLGLGLQDCTSGYRCYSSIFLSEVIGRLHSHTYEIQIETVRQAALRHFQVKETPVLFVNRKRGKSKLTWTEIQSFLSYTFKAVWNSS